MIGLLQRVSEAEVVVEEKAIATIGPGLLVLVGIQRDDGESQADRLLQRLLGYRVFNDGQGRMNRSVADTGGGLLLVPQFTLAADTNSGTRPGFSTAAQPDQARQLFEYLCRQASGQHDPFAQGEFGAHMKVSLTNDGPVTFWLEV